MYEDATKTQQIVVDEKTKKKVVGTTVAVGVIIALGALAWALLGVAAFITSIVCFGRPASPTGLNVVGLLIAVFTGPFYWLYYGLAKSYCRK